MRVHVVSDIHGNADALARACEGADALVVLGDLIDFVDYIDHGRGILGALFGAEKVRGFARLRRGGDREAMVAYMRQLWASLENPGEAVDEAIRSQYAELFAAMTIPTFATPGNVDTPDLWAEFAYDHIEVLDGASADLGGLRFGFVGGGLLPPGVSRRRPSAWRPYMRDEAEHAAAVAALGQVDVLCSHIPPAVADLTYDVVARRSEGGSVELLDYIERAAPRWSLFGHVHQPLAAHARIGRTECRNVGHFQRTENPFVLRW